jgi:hypothetical protein
MRQRPRKQLFVPEPVAELLLDLGEVRLVSQ